MKATSIPAAISITAKCCDLFSAQLQDEAGYALAEYTGYVPNFMPGEHYGDYVELRIDLVSGRILNWRPPTKAQLKQTFGKF